MPENWVYVSLEDIVDYEQPQPYIVENTDYSDEFKTPVLTAGKSFILGYTNEEFGVYNRLPAIIFDDFTTDSHFVDFPFKVKSSAMKILSVRSGISIEYVAYFMAITRLSGDTHKRYWISEYSKILIPLPPKAEQERIVLIIKDIFKQLSLIQGLLD
ncbi:MAG: restriction endonuclease subunit S [Muribaculaceae bacterium]|nr:restriction endonuclease subunit S [Muribaculaceae bacterium]